MDDNPLTDCYEEHAEGMVGRKVAEVLILIVCLEPEVPEVEPEPLLAAAADEEVPHVVPVEEGDQGHRQGGRHTQPGHTPSVTNPSPSRLHTVPAESVPDDLLPVVAAELHVADHQHPVHHHHAGDQPAQHSSVRNNIAFQNSNIFSGGLWLRKLM